MEERISDRIEKYMNQVIVREVHRVIESTSTQRHDLEEFATFMERRKSAGRNWELTELTEEDGREYYRHVRSRGDIYGAERKVKTIHSFLDFAISKGWIKRRPWGNIF
jgi:site-specific recombinase XerD